MNRKIGAWLEYISRSIDEIFDFLPEKRDFLEYQKDLKTKKAVNRISKYQQASIEIKNAKKIIDTRNRIVHDYENISDEVIWTIILRELSQLKIEVADHLK
jgi:uncharacterized protein with HEPN domain